MRLPTMVDEKLVPLSELEKLDPIERLKALIPHLALTDVTNIVALRIAPCRYCYGKDHDYQWRTEREFQEQKQIFAKTQELVAAEILKIEDVSKPTEPSDAGGYDYTRLKSPHPNCPKCEGQGVAWVHNKDHTSLDYAHRMLLNGVKQKANGEIEVLIGDKIQLIEAINELTRLHAMAIDAKDDDVI